MSTDPEALLLTINAGSSSLRFGLFRHRGDAAPAALLRGRIAHLGGTRPELRLNPAPGEATREGPDMRQVGDHGTAIAALCDWLPAATGGRPLLGAGHRVVHGAGRTAPAPVDPALLEEIEALIPLAPLHLPHDLAAIRALHRALPECRQLACFDTAFHRTLPARSRRFALPDAALPPGTERYGFHGLSYEYVAGRLREIAPAARRVVVAHLGNGASLCALLDGISVETTMSLTPLDGVPMGTRSGAVDPGLLLLLLERGLDPAQLRELLYRQSGLLGLSGLSGDMRTLLASQDPRAAEAVTVFVYQCARAVAALAVALGGLDAVVFTGGIGENAAPVRAGILAQLDWLGLELDPSANARHAQRISTAQSPTTAWVIPTDEEQVLATHAARLL